VEVPRKQLIIETLSVFAVALAVRLPQIGHTGFYDEFYHVLAARSWVEDGSLHIGNGVYDRGAAYTVLIGWIFRLFGDSLVAARMSSVFAGALLVALIYVWTRFASTRAAALITAALFCIAPMNVYLSQIARFYALHSLLVFAGSIAVYFAWTNTKQGRPKLVAWVGAAVLFALAVHLQPTTGVPLLALAAWVLADFLLDGRLSWESTKKYAIIGVPVLVAGGLLAAILLPLGEILQIYRASSLWARGSEDSALFYHSWLVGEYAVLWSLFPIAALVAYNSRFRRPVSFSTVVFLIAFVVHSFAGAKHGRYLAYALPFFFIVWGIALTRAFPWLCEAARDAYVNTFPRSKDRWGPRLAEGAVLVVVAGFLAASTPAPRLTYRMLASPESRWPANAPKYRGESDWARAAPLLKEASNAAAVVLTSAGVKAQYYLARFDFELSETILAEARPPRQFGLDTRTGRRVVSSPESVRQIVDCYPTGLVVVEEHHWRSAWSVNDAVADFFEETGKPIELPPSMKLRAYTWRHSDAITAETCSQFVSGQRTNP